MKDRRDYLSILERIRYEAWGNRIMPHCPKWGNECLQTEVGPGSDHIAWRIEDLGHILERLGRNETLERLAAKWRTPSTPDGRDGDNERVWGCHITSGSETNGKEALQLLALTQAVREARKPNSGDAAGIYFIDTASHPMKNQLYLEAKMYGATASGMARDDILAYYLSLFSEVDPNYIDRLLEALKTPDEDKQEARRQWARRITELDVPADAIILPSKAKYLKFCEHVGMEGKVVEAIGRAFDFVIGRDDIPKTLGSLRCAIFTEVSTVLLQELGLKGPIISVPFDEAAISMGWGNLTLRQIQDFSRETFADKVAFFNILDPMTGIETPLYNRDCTNSSVYVYGSIAYRDIMQNGHFSGMGYYLSLITRGIGSFAFVLDNYEASGPHRRLIRAEAEGRFQSGVVMIGYPRGWVRIAGFAAGENLTYGASPPLELLASELLKDPRGPKLLHTYIKLLNENIGKNVTIALDASAAMGSTLWVVPDNREFAKTKTNEPVNVLPVEPSEASVAIHGLRSLLTKDGRETLEQQLEHLKTAGIADENPTLKSYFEQSERLRAIESTLRDMTAKFNEAHENEAKAYYVNRLKAMIEVFQVEGPFFRYSPSKELRGENSPDNFYNSLLSDTTPAIAIHRLAERMYNRLLNVIRERQRPSPNAISNNFHNLVRQKWSELNSQDPKILEYVERHRKFRDAMQPLIQERNKLQSKIQNLRPEVEGIIRELKHSVILVE